MPWTDWRRRVSFKSASISRTRARASMDWTRKLWRWWQSKWRCDYRIWSIQITFSQGCYENSTWRSGQHHPRPIRWPPRQWRKGKEIFLGFYASLSEPITSRKLCVDHNHEELVLAGARPWLNRKIGIRNRTNTCVAFHLYLTLTSFIYSNTPQLASGCAAAVWLCRHQSLLGSARTQFAPKACKKPPCLRCPLPALQLHQMAGHEGDT